MELLNIISELNKVPYEYHVYRREHLVEMIGEGEGNVWGSNVPTSSLFNIKLRKGVGGGNRKLYTNVTR